jgi:hypothetical protein
VLIVCDVPLPPGCMVQPQRKSTAERIARVGGNVLQGSAEWVPSSYVDADGRVIEGKSRAQSKYRLGEVQSTMSQRLDFFGSGFNISNEHGAPIVTFGGADDLIE